MRIRVLPTAFAVAVLSVGAAPSTAAGEQEAASGVPKIHLLPPPGDYAPFDPALPAAGLRLVAQELAARHGAYARYWPAERAWRISDDAYPRIKVAAERLKSPRFLRLRRDGDTFFASASEDGETYMEIGRQTLDVPSAMYVGLFVNAQSGGQPARYRFASPTLDGDPFPAHQVEHIGKAAVSGEVRRDGEKWTVRTNGHSGTDHQPTLTGTFAYAKQKGDFVLEVKVRDVRVQASRGQVGGLLCRAGLGSRRKGFASLATRKSAASGWTVPHTERKPADDEKEGSGGTGPQLRQRMTYTRDRSSHVLRASLVPEKGKEVPLASVPVTTATFDTFVDGTEALAEEILTALEDRYGLSAEGSGEDVALSEQQRHRLESARKKSLEAGGRHAMHAARRVDGVLRETPSSAAAHYTAAGVASRLACQDLHGAFDLRGHFLAAPVSHLLMARRRRPPETAAEKLDVAWTVLACGYPDRALSIVDGLSEKAKGRPEVRAIRLFATRDYRKLPVADLPSATPMEQLAWAWAVQQTGRTDLAEKGGRVLLQRRPRTAYMLLYGGAGVGFSHRLTPSLVAAACGENVRTLLTSPQLPEKKRRWMANKLARVVGVETSGRESPATLAAVARKVRRAILRRNPVRPNPHLAKLLHQLVQVYWWAWKESGPVVRDGDTLAWRTLDARTVARFEQGLLLLALTRRITFLGHQYGDPRVAARYASTAAEGFRRMDKQADYFRAFEMQLRGRTKKAGKLLRPAVQKLRYSGRPGFVSALMDWWGNAYKRYGRLRVPAPGGRGSWDWGLATWVGSRGRGVLARPAAMHAHRVDRHDAYHISTCRWLVKNLDVLADAVDRMPYHAWAINRTAYLAATQERTDLAIRMRKRLRDLQPTVASHYSVLANLYASKEKTEKAMATLKNGVDNVSEGVGWSNLAAQYANALRHRGKVDKALKYARRAAQTYSQAALEAYAWALEAKGRKKEAFKVVRDTYKRYAGGARLLVSILARRGEPDRLRRELRRYLRHHERPDYQALLAGAIQSGSPDFLELLYEENVLDQPAHKRLPNLMQCALHGRHFEKVLDYSRRLADERKRSPAELLWTYVAARLLGDEETVDAIRKPLRAYRSDQTLRPVVRFMRGEIDRAALRESTVDHKLFPAQKKWVLGAEAEARGDLSSAVRLYHEAAHEHTDSPASRVPAAWHRRLEKKVEKQEDDGEG